MKGNDVKMETECHFHVTDEYDSDFVYLKRLLWIMQK